MAAVTSEKLYKTGCKVCKESLSLATRGTVICNTSAGGCGRLCHNRCEILQSIEKDSIIIYQCSDCCEKFADKPASPQIPPPSETLVYSPVLSFFRHCLQSGISSASCISSCTNFYSYDHLDQARSLLTSLVNPTHKLLARRGPSAKQSLSQDILDILISEDATPRLPNLKFVMTASDAIPAIDTDQNAHFSRAIQTWDRHLFSIIDKLDYVTSKVAETPALVKECCDGVQSEVLSCINKEKLNDKSWPPLNNESETVGLVVDSPPQDCDDPLKREAFLKSLDGADGIVRISLSKESGSQQQKWVIHTKRQNAENLKACLNEKVGKTEVRKSRIVGLLSRVDFPINPESVCASNQGIEEIQRIGVSKSYRVYFRSVTAKSHYLRHGIHIGYEHFRLTDYKFLPRMCYKCGSLEHISSGCSSVERCLKCLGSGHSHSRNNPCQNEPCCFHCGSHEHTGFSFRCKQLTEKVAKNKK